MSPQRIKLNPEMVAAAIGDAYSEEQVDAALQLLAAGQGQFPSGVRKLPVGETPTGTRYWHRPGRHREGSR